MLSTNEPRRSVSLPLDNVDLRGQQRRVRLCDFGPTRSSMTTATVLRQVAFGHAASSRSPRNRPTRLRGSECARLESNQRPFAPEADAGIAIVAGNCANG